LTVALAKLERSSDRDREDLLGLAPAGYIDASVLKNATWSGDRVRVTDSLGDGTRSAEVFDGLRIPLLEARVESRVAYGVGDSCRMLVTICQLACQLEGDLRLCEVDSSARMPAGMCGRGLEGIYRTLG
jgi:hypothetical protein